MLKILAFVCLLFVAAAFTGKTASGLPQSGNTTFINSNAFAKASSSQGSTAIPKLAGSNWKLISMTKKGEAIKERTSPPTIDFCGDGSWNMLHYGGTQEGGTYKIQGARIVMKYDDGSSFGDYKLVWNSNKSILELDSGDYLLQLTPNGKVNC